MRSTLRSNLWISVPVNYWVSDTIGCLWISSLSFFLTEQTPMFFRATVYPTLKKKKKLQHEMPMWQLWQLKCKSSHLMEFLGGLFKGETWLPPILLSSLGLLSPAWNRKWPWRWSSHPAWRHHYKDEYHMPRRAEQETEGAPGPDSTRVPTSSWIPNFQTTFTRKTNTPIWLIHCKLHCLSCTADPTLTW